MSTPTVPRKSRLEPIVDATEARESFSELLSRASFGRERILIRRNRKAAAALVPMEDVELLVALDDFIDLTDARAALREAQRKGTVSWDAFRKELGL